MLDPARPQARVHAAQQSGRPGWGIVDLIPAALMLPFGLAMFLIERLVLVVTAGFNE